MAKRKSVEPEPERYAKDDEVLIASDEFVYEVDTYQLQSRQYNLEDSVYINRKTLKIEGLRVAIKKGTKCYVQIYKLIAAPKTWLQQNKFTFIT